MRRWGTVASDASAYETVAWNATADELKAGIMRRTATYGLLVLFLLFLITANPSGTGQSGREFLGWLSGGWDDTREFVSTLIGESDGDPETNEFGEVIIPTVAPDVVIPTVAPEVIVVTPTPLPVATTETVDPAVVE